MNLGRRIYYDLITGNKILDTGEWKNAVKQKSVDQDIAAYHELSERNRDTFDVLELPFGAYQQDFAECIGYRVNVETGELDFKYPDPNEPDVEQPYVKALSEEVKRLTTENKAQDQVIEELMFTIIPELSGGGI